MMQQWWKNGRRRWRRRLRRGGRKRRQERRSNKDETETKKNRKGGRKKMCMEGGGGGGEKWNGGGEMISWRTTIGGREHTDESHWPHGGATVQAKTTRPLSCKKLLLLFSKSSLIFTSFIQSPLQKDFSCTSASCFSLQICRLIS